MSGASELAELFVHTATVETFQGTGSEGDVFTSPVALAGFWDGSRKMTRNSSGELVTSGGAFYTAVENVAVLTVNSRLTYAGNSARVMAVELHTSGVLGLPDHIAVTIE